MNLPQHAQGPLVQDTGPYNGPYYGAQPAGTDVSGTSWGAIFAGAAGAAALSLILLILGVGLGLSSVSPWAQAGISAATFGVSTIIWITFTQLAASGTGGYLAGRLRRKWAGVHTDEVYFRDTAHGFLAWSIATIATAALLAGTIGSILGGGVQAGASIAGGAASTAAVAAAGAGGAAASANDQGSAYAVDSLFRRDLSAAPATGAATANPVTLDTSAAQNSPAASTAEVGRIFANGLRTDAALPPEDVKYVGQLVTQRTGLSQPDAEKRVADTYNKVQAKAREVQLKAKEAADQARKTSAYAALWLFISLLLGAFVASLFATFGGRHRDL
jgi:hypothetical protein